jgi:hypothetical protein
MEGKTVLPGNRVKEMFQAMCVLSPEAEFSAPGNEHSERGILYVKNNPKLSLITCHEDYYGQRKLKEQRKISRQKKFRVKHALLQIYCFTHCGDKKPYAGHCLFNEEVSDIFICHICTLNPFERIVPNLAHDF